ncbi:MAG: PepSY domain-containing protein [Planctomycetota bacterium]
MTQTADAAAERRASLNRHRKRYNAAMKLVRRVHMYSGLILAPFMLMYAVTGIFFNHPDLLSPRSSAPPDQELTEGLSFDPASDIAAEVVRLINEQLEQPATLLSDHQPKIVGPLILETITDTERARYVFNADLSGRRSVTPLVEGIPSEPSLPASLEPQGTQTLDELINRIGTADGVQGVSIRSVPDVEFVATIDGEDWLIGSDLRTGAVSSRRIGSPSTPYTIRDYLLQLHLARGYWGGISLESAWALFVDLTAALMIFWVLSGFIMWWQMKPTRRAGVVATAAGIGLSLLIGFAMLRMLYY